jgi:hypothetical protein
MRRALCRREAAVEYADRRLAARRSGSVARRSSAVKTAYFPKKTGPATEHNRHYRTFGGGFAAFD